MSSQQWQTLDKYLEEDWNHVEVSFAMSIGTVKWCGVHAYKKETNMDDIQFTIPNAQNAIVPFESNHDVAREREDVISYTEVEKIDNSLQLLKYFRISKTTDKDKAIMVYYEEHETKMWARGTNIGKEITIKDDKRTTAEEDEGDAKIEQKKTLGEKSISFAYRMSEHVRLRSKLSDTVSSALNFGAAFVVMGGRENIFKITFGMKEGEELLKASHCYKNTTAAPIPGALFISTEKVAFCSEDFDDKLVILIGNIKDVTLSRNVKEPTQKYIEIVTEDKSKYQFRGFLRYESAFKNLRKAISRNSEKMTMKIDEAAVKAAHVAIEVADETAHEVAVEVTDEAAHEVADELSNAIVMEPEQKNELQCKGTSSVACEICEQVNQAPKISENEKCSSSLGEKVIQEEEKISDTMKSTFTLGAKMVRQSGKEKISFLRKKLPSPFKSS
ncbi:GEM-like protein 4 [Quillaja saponaria]|uniref:GEM-like protein 4 n=1 Tax=Quillaja saponaria TaxID=32244 RepID=A0AAD7VGX6_QUISA|nr:GEM-like protein 4 [Quillaja saponaria]